MKRLWMLAVASAFVLATSAATAQDADMDFTTGDDGGGDDGGSDDGVPVFYAG